VRQAMSLDDLFSRAQVVTVHVPLARARAGW
jgi:phosphoglycerate dehydrogenase-like enzyme